MPSTPQIVKNLAEEIAGFRLGKNWTGQFFHRHRDRLCSLYLRNVDYPRIKAESEALFEEFYQLLELLPSI